MIQERRVDNDMIQHKKVISTIGSRKYTRRDIFTKVMTDKLSKLDKKSIILLSGGCDGPDTWGRELSKQNNIPFIEVTPGGYTKDDYFERNCIVSQLADEVFAFIPRGQMQSGTWNTILYFRTKSDNYTVYDENGNMWDRDWKYREWNTIEHPGFFGSVRDKLFKKWDNDYGRLMWRIAYVWGDSVIERNMALQLYEDAYYNFFEENYNILNWLIDTASNVYDNAKSNVYSGTDYTIQETRSTHLQDISIRRVLLRMGVWFKGDKLIQIRSNNEEGKILSPKNIPFHMPNMIHDGKIKDYGNKGKWWTDGSIEDFYQRNKVLQVLQ